MATKEPNHPRVSVIIPTWNEASTIDRCLTELIKQQPDEIIVADAESPDNTAELAQAYAKQNVQVLRSPKGRAAQQNHGASIALGDVLLFLHADCRLDQGALAELRQLVRKYPKISGGCFRMRVDDKHLFYMSINVAADLRGSWCGIPYGDQGLFSTRWAFEKVGGFPQVPLMEDLMLSTSLRRVGRMAILKSAIRVSNRRWKQTGIIRQSVRNWGLTTVAALGVSPNQLVKYYPVVR